MALYGWTQGIGWGEIFKRILENLNGIASGSSSIVVTAGAGTPSTQADAVVATAGTRVLAIAGGQKGMLSAAIDNDGFMYVGDVTVTNASGGKKGIILSQAGMSPILTGPVYVDADNNGDLVGVTYL